MSQTMRAMSILVIGLASVLVAFPFMSDAFAVSDEYRSNEPPLAPPGLALPRSEVFCSPVFSCSLFGFVFGRPLRITARL